MDQLLKEHEKLCKKANLSKSVDEVQSLIEEVQQTRQALLTGDSSAPVAFAKLQSTSRKRFENVQENIKEIHGAQSKYAKALSASPLLKNSATSSAAKDPATGLPLFGDTPMSAGAGNGQDDFTTNTKYINKAIIMHLMRDGLFHVAELFAEEAENALANDRTTSLAEDTSAAMDLSSSHNKLSQQLSNGTSVWSTEVSPRAFKSAELQRKFESMYSILRELKINRNLAPAIQWAREHSAILDARGSNLEFELCRLQYMTLFTSTKPGEGPLAAIEYAQGTFPAFPLRYIPQIRQLLGALAFAPNVAHSPYSKLFGGQSADSSDTIRAASDAFSSEFCALLQLSSASPLLTAVTAGCIALPTLVKFSAIQAAKRTSWTTSAELPVGIPLPPGYQFHSIFVCPVSKDQTTDANPPMMMPCGHVIARESMDRLSKNGRFKCPYCPGESHPKEAMMLYF